MAELIFFRRREELMRVAIETGARIVIGRSSACDVVVPDPDVAPTQCAIEGDGLGRFWLVSLANSCCESCSPRREAFPLDDGRKIPLGDWHAVFHLHNEDARAHGACPRSNETRLFTPSPRGRARRLSSRRRMDGPDLPLFWDRLVVRAPKRREQPRSERVMPCPDRLVIGSAKGCDLVLDDPFASACHALLERRGEARWLRDLNSSNGTFVGTARILESELPLGVTARIGQSELVLMPAEQGVGEQGFEGIIGSSPAMRELFSVIERVAASDATALIVGESGTGKELVARALHARSARASGPFVPVNCGALSESLIESELFGHEKGAFTGADKARRGAFEEAGGGTLFLDEIGELPMALQAKLLRALELREIKRVGASLPLRVELRVIGATNRDLRAEISAGRFREDLYWRLAAIPIWLPPLRSRGEEDLRALVRHFLKSFTCSVRLSAGAEARLLAHRWPGNVRELKNCLNRTVLLRRTDFVQADDIAFDEAFGEAREDEKTPPEAARDTAARRTTAGALCIDIAGKTFAQIEEEVFVRTCEQLDFRVAAVARALGQSRGTIYRRMERLGLGPRRESDFD